MAELTYDDVRRAAEAAISNLQNSVNDLRNNMQNVRNDIGQPQALQNRITNIERILNDLLLMLQRLDAGMNNNNPSALPALQSLQMGMQQQDRRLANMEQFIGDMSNYLQAMHDEITRAAEGKPSSRQNSAEL